MHQIEHEARRIGPNGDELGTADEVAAFLKKPITTLYRWRRFGTGPRASRVGRSLRYRWADVYRWLDQQAGDDAA